MSTRVYCQHRFLDSQSCIFCGWTPDLTPEMMSTPEFEAVWQCIEGWSINVPDDYSGYCKATGNHVRSILDALRTVSLKEDKVSKMAKSPEELIARIGSYLGNGGLYNPDMMEHDKVRDLIIDCRDFLLIHQR